VATRGLRHPVRASPSPRLTFRIDFEGGRLGHGKIELLEHIARSGSLSAAARSMDMSYRRAWQLLAAMNAMFDEPVTVTHPGRNTSGATEVTPFGERLVVAYRRLEARLARAAQPTIERITAGSTAARARKAGVRRPAKRRPAR
jgi:molybdate transport system regulatory protein